MEIKVIILDDSVDDWSGKTKVLLEAQGYKVILAENVSHFKKQVRKAAELKEEVILLNDINLAGWNEGKDGGIRVMEELKQEGIRFPVVFVTAYADDETSEIYKRAKLLSPFFLGQGQTDIKLILGKIEEAFGEFYSLNTHGVFIYTGGTINLQYHFIKLEDVCYWESEEANGNRSNLYLSSGELINRALQVGVIWKQLQEKANCPFLVRLGSGPIININNLQYYEDGSLYFRGKNVKPLLIRHNRWVGLKRILFSIQS